MFRNLFIVVLAVYATGVCAQSGSGDAGSLFEEIARHASALADSPYKAPKGEHLPAVLRALDYEDYRDIRFRKENALWRGDALFNVEFFHLGFLYERPVRINEVIGDRVERVRYRSSLFDYGDNEQLEGALGPHLGFAGFRLHYPLNTPEYKDELVVFLGASYFRMVGRGQRYGLSARGLAIDVASPGGEEFPRFKEFWLVKPEPDATSMTIYALLNSRSVTGVYRFDLHPGRRFAMDVRARLFARADVNKLGLAPMTSMFMWGENRVRHFDDHRPEVHDSDGLLVHNGAGEWIWRPLTNPAQLRVSSLLTSDPRGFGLVQRDREFRHYLDPEAAYERRPSLWVKPTGGAWGSGAVQLVEIPSEDESNDNIVAYWVPSNSLEADESIELSYRIETFGNGRVPESLASVARTRIGWGAIPGSDEKPSRQLRQFVVDFQGGALEGLDAAQPVEARLTARDGSTRHVTVEQLPESAGWRVAFKLMPDSEDEAVDLSMHLTLRGKRISETWNYVWDPAAME
ncbi:glucan biosynthesis protein [Ectothiorhodospiraceae bacterium WFHF3C12]|nr:glucan biosynthesis protein [Ectothiorhodospiraceae bacterium WFHF3C12]